MFFKNGLVANGLALFRVWFGNRHGSQWLDPVALLWGIRESALGLNRICLGVRKKHDEPQHDKTRKDERRIG
ncbi:hypothetical protein CA13_01510 [Planctomycetes bacterium CA13]|uniref:Uncharacterized protein n=1 Tax=Novipirellula herctigrandis TaxID=2527986 RepID=A0A5C5YUR8_9BACT|nr:hypothetical protein CA13_01510 [Planctomycetes bacterium CA13]